jgi:hypothetical protein
MAEVRVRRTTGQGPAHEDKTAAEAFDWLEDWREKLVEAQEMVVYALQVRLLGEVVGLVDGERSTTANRRSGEIKDLAVALGVAVDKLNELKAMYHAAGQPRLPPPAPPHDPEMRG